MHEIAPALARSSGASPRPLYVGCIGYRSFNGNLVTYITIRKVLLKNGNAYVPAGGRASVNDSEPEAEFQETANKNKALLESVALAGRFGEGNELRCERAGSVSSNAIKETSYQSPRPNGGPASSLSSTARGGVGGFAPAWRS